MMDMQSFLAPFLFMVTFFGMLVPSAHFSFPWSAVEMQTAVRSTAVIPDETAAASDAKKTTTSPVAHPETALPATVHALTAVSVQLEPVVSPTPVKEERPTPVHTTPVTATVQISSIEQGVIAGINTARATEGLSALSADTKLIALARAHSADMLSKTYFSHTDLSGCSTQCRYDAAGYAYWTMGENMYWMEGYDLSDADVAAKVVASWMASEGHRENNLGPFTGVGVGVARSGSKVYVTADFAKPR